MGDESATIKMEEEERERSPFHEGGNGSTQSAQPRPKSKRTDAGSLEKKASSVSSCPTFPSFPPPIAHLTHNTQGPPPPPPPQRAKSRICGCWSLLKLYLSVGAEGGGYTISVSIKMPTLSLGHNDQGDRRVPERVHVEGLGRVKIVSCTWARTDLRLAAGCAFVSMAKELLLRTCQDCVCVLCVCVLCVCVCVCLCRQQDSCYHRVKRPTEREATM